VVIITEFLTREAEDGRAGYNGLVADIQIDYYSGNTYMAEVCRFVFSTEIFEFF